MAKLSSFIPWSLLIISRLYLNTPFLLEGNTDLQRAKDFILIRILLKLIKKMEPLEFFIARCLLQSLQFNYLTMS